MRKMKVLFLLATMLGCVLGYAESSHSFLVISDIHLDVSSKHTMDFSPKTATILNDLDVPTYQKLLDTIHTSIATGDIPKPEFMIVLGDLVGHRRHSSQSVVETERIVFSALRDTFPDIPVLYSFGNNDSLATDYGPFQTDDTSLSVRSPLDVMKTVWPHGHYLSSGAICNRDLQTYPCLLARKVSGGYYSAYLKPNLRLISLNSVMFSKHQTGYTREAVSAQLTWFEQQLQAAEKHNESVIVLTHIPPGDNVYRPYFWSNTNFWSDKANAQFIKSVITHHLNITGILAAHTHKDEIKVIENNSHIILAGVYMNAALSTSHGNAPSIRSYTFKQTKYDTRWDLSDYQTYYFTKNTDASLNTHVLYQFQAIYCNTLVKRMGTCLDNVTMDQVKSRMQAGNPHFYEKISAPENLHIVDYD